MKDKEIVIQRLTMSGEGGCWELGQWEVFLRKGHLC